METTGQRLKELIERLKLTQKDLALALGLPAQKICDIANDKHKLTIEIAILIQQKYHINGWWLLTGLDEKNLYDDDIKELISIYKQLKPLYKEKMLLACKSIFNEQKLCDPLLAHKIAQ